MQKAWPTSVVTVVKSMSQFSCEIAVVEGGRVRRFMKWVDTAMGFFNCNNQDSFGSSIYPKTSCKLNCTSKGFSCNFLDLTVRQSPQGLSCNIFDKRSQPEYAGIEIIRMPHVHSNISMTAKLRVFNSQFYRFLRLCSCKKFFVFQMVNLIVFLKAKGYPLKVLLKRTRGLVLQEKFLFGISAFGIFRMILLRVM
jgi:hypothetical protein